MVKSIAVQGLRTLTNTREREMEREGEGERGREVTIYEKEWSPIGYKQWKN